MCLETDSPLRGVTTLLVDMDDCLYPRTTGFPQIVQESIHKYMVEELKMSEYVGFHRRDDSEWARGN